MAGEDVLSVGREPAGGRRSVVLLAVIAVVVFGGWRLLGDDIGASRAPVVRPAPSHSPATVSTPSPASRSVGEQRLSLGVETGTRLLLSGHAVVDIDLDKGRTRQVSVPGSVTQVVHARTGDFVLSQLGSSEHAAFFLSSDRGRLAPLGEAGALVPAAGRDRIWIADAPSAIGRLRLVTSTGEVRRRIHTGPDIRAVVRETPTGLLTMRLRDHSTSLELWDPRDRRVLRTYGAGGRVMVLDANATHVAFSLPACPRACPILISRLRTGATARVAVPPTWYTAAAAFSPDGRSLAVVGVQTRRGRPADHRLLIVDVPAGRVDTTRGLDARPQPLSLVAWAPDGRWIFAASRGARSNLIGYRPADALVSHVSEAGRGDALFDGLTALTTF